MKNWPHTPIHLFERTGLYMVTGATYKKDLIFKRTDDLTALQELLFELAEYYKWDLQAWALFANHYHFLAYSPNNPNSLKTFVTHLHSTSARNINQKYGTTGRMIWYQYWDSHITFPKSYYARLNYVMQNPVKHKLVTLAEEYPWCSAYWFSQNASLQHQKTVKSFKINHVQILDEF